MNRQHSEKTPSGRPLTARIEGLDILRGLTLLSMTAYHAMWDVVYLAGVPVRWYTSLPGYLWQQSICWCFILLSGFCLQLGRRPVRRGLTVWLSGWLVTAVTLLFDPGAPIWFGVLTLLGSCMILAGALRPLLCRKVQKAGLSDDASSGTGMSGNMTSKLGLAINILLFLLTRNVNRGTLGFEAIDLIRLPSALYGKTASAPFGFLMTALGFPAQDFVSVDYFSLLPWFFLFMTGFYLYGTFQEKIAGLQKAVPHPRSRNPLAFLGRHSLLIYLLHQPVIYGVLLLWTGML